MSNEQTQPEPEYDDTAEQVTPFGYDLVNPARAQQRSFQEAMEAEANAASDSGTVEIFEGNVDDTLAHIEAHPDLAQAHLDAENAREHPRKGVVDALTARLEAAD
jgi:hypothetical protein